MLSSLIDFIYLLLPDGCFSTSEEYEGESLYWRMGWFILGILCILSWFFGDYLNFFWCVGLRILFTIWFLAHLIIRAVLIHHHCGPQD